MSRTIVTISRMYASGGHIIGQKLAERLGIPFYDRKLIDMIAHETGLSPEFIEQTEQTRPSSLLYGLYTSHANLPVFDQIDVSERKVIRDLAAKGSCVLLGRCADYILKGDPGLTRVFIYAPATWRARQLYAQRGSGEDEIKAEVARMDKKRAGYYHYVTGQKIGECENYDLTLNSQIGFVRAVGAILAAMGRR